MARHPRTRWEMPTTITEHVAKCLQDFHAVSTASLDSLQAGSKQAPVLRIRDQFARFKVWCGNIGGHRHGKSSLDYRLRDASHLATQVMSLLNDLGSSLTKVRSILSGDTIPWDEITEEDDDDEDLGVPDEDDIGFPTELDQISADVVEVINCLLNLSVSMRNPAPHDRFRGSVDTDTSFYEASDIAHVKTKFSGAGGRLIELLGKANSRRRQYFKYRESHHAKLSAGLNPTATKSEFGQSTIASSIPDGMKKEGPDTTLVDVDEDDVSNSGLTQTSYAASSENSERPRFPHLPSVSADGPFECPFCYMMISVTSTHAWRKHIFADLRPYICIDVDCPISGVEFSRRRQWMDHMLQSHWRDWQCTLCQEPPVPTSGELKKHVKSSHTASVTNEELVAFVDLCEIQRSLKTSLHCPLCLEFLSSAKLYRRHVGRHLEDLAMFVLPRLADDGEPVSEASTEHSVISDGSRDDHVYIDPEDELLARTNPLFSGALKYRVSAASSMEGAQVFDTEARDQPQAERQGTENITYSKEDAANAEPVIIENDIINLSGLDLSEYEENEKRIKQKMELHRLKEEKEALADKNRHDKEAKEAIKRYIWEETERQLKEEEEEAEREKAHKNKIQEQLLKAGLDEKQINAILVGRKPEKQKEKENLHDDEDDDGRPTYTRMARRHLSLETLRVFNIDYQLDTDPDYVLIKRWVPEDEQDRMWRHTRNLREQRDGKLVMTTGDKPKKHNYSTNLEPEFEWVRKKERRSKSPGLLMYLAGAKPGSFKETEEESQV